MTVKWIKFYFFNKIMIIIFPYYLMYNYLVFYTIFFKWNSNALKSASQW